MNNSKSSPAPKAKKKSRRLSRRDLAAHLGVSLRTIDSWRRDGIAGVHLEPTYVGGRTYYTARAYREFRDAITEKKTRRPVQRNKLKTHPESIKLLRQYGLID